MIHADWLKSNDPQRMVAFLQDCGKLPERKARLFTVACCRRIWPLLTDERSRQAVEVAERAADGKSDSRERYLARLAASAAASAARAACTAAVEKLPAWRAAAAAALAVSGPPGLHAADDWAALAVGEEANRPNAAGRAERAAQAVLLRDIADPFRSSAAVPAKWRTRSVLDLVHRVYEERRLPEGTLDPALLGQLAEALTGAGCDDVELLAHLRSEDPHVRGCTAIDLILSKDR